MKTIPFEVSHSLARYVKGKVTETKLKNLAKVSGYPIHLLRKAAVQVGRMRDPETKELTVPASELSSFRMSCGNEKRYSRVIDEGVVKNWVGIGWVDEGKATDADYKKYPTVKR